MRKKFSVILLSLFLSSCASNFQMKHEDFSSLQKGKKIAAFGVKLTHDGKKINTNPMSDFSSSCRLYFSKDGKFFSEAAYQYKASGDYVFVDTDNDDLYLTGVECAEYRVFYNKVRFKSIGNKIFSFANGDKINYGGDLEIEWNSEIFKLTDLFLLGHLGINDHGSFSMRVTEDYDHYLSFMKSTYGFEKEKSVKSVDKALVKEPVLKLKSETEE